jgi:hypothetical protein
MDGDHVSSLLGMFSSYGWRLRLRCHACWKEARRQLRPYSLEDPKGHERHVRESERFAALLVEQGWRAVENKAVCPACSKGGRDPDAPRRIGGLGPEG